MQCLAVYFAIQLRKRIFESVIERLTVCIHHAEPAQDADTHPFADTESAPDAKSNTESAPDAKSNADAEAQPHRDFKHNWHLFPNADRAVVRVLRVADALGADAISK